MKSAAVAHDPQRVLFSADNKFPVNFDVLETEAGSYLVAIVQGNNIHFIFFYTHYTRSERKTLTLRNEFDEEYQEVLLVARFGSGEAGELLCAAGETGCVYLVSLASFERIDFWALRQHLKTVMDVRFASRGRLLTASQDHAVILWDLGRHTVLCKWVDTAARLSAANQVVPCAAEQLFLAGYDDAVVRGLDAELGEVVFAARGLVDANICAMEALGALVFVRSVTGRLAVASLDAGRRRLTVLRFFNLNVGAFSYFDGLSACRGALLLFGCQEGQWAALALAGEAGRAQLFGCAALAKVKRVFLAERCALVLLCDEQRVVYDYVTL